MTVTQGRRREHGDVVFRFAEIWRRPKDKSSTKQAKGLLPTSSPAMLWLLWLCNITAVSCWVWSFWNHGKWPFPSGVTLENDGPLHVFPRVTIQGYLRSLLESHCRFAGYYKATIYLASVPLRPGCAARY